MITHPPLKLGAGLRGPKVGGDPQKSPTFGFRGSECFPPLVVHDGAYKNWKYNSRLTGGVLPPNPKNHQNCGNFFPGDPVVRSESVFLTCCPLWQPRGKISKSFFSKISSQIYEKNLPERATHTSLRNGIIRNPPSKLGAGPGGPQSWGDPNIFHFRFPGVGIFLTFSTERRSLQKLGSNSRLAGGVLPPNPKTPTNCVSLFAISGRQIWTKVQIYTLQIP